jgi:integrase-like protein
VRRCGGREDLAGDRLPVLLGGAGARTRRPLLVTESGGRLDRGAVWRLLRRLAKAAGIAVMMSPHVLRHTCATLARDAGVPLDDVQDGLGHADPRTTRRYDHGGVRLDRSPRLHPRPRADRSLERASLPSARPPGWARRHRQDARSPGSARGLPRRREGNPPAVALVDVRRWSPVTVR